MVEAKTKVESSVEYAEQFLKKKKKIGHNIPSNCYSLQRLDNTDVLHLQYLPI